MRSHKLFYAVKPLIPRRLQIYMRRIIAMRQLNRYQDIWPIDRRAGTKPEGWPGWPDGKRFAFILTHDVDTARGQDKCRDLMELEKKLGFRSSFNFVPERYAVSEVLRKDLVQDGFEVGVHGLYHDGKYFESRKVFQERAIRINHYLKQWDAVGFRAPSMLHNLEWINDLNIEYDASTFDTDPFEPQADGMTTIFPFWFHQNGSGKGYVELPYTLPQDFTLFILMRESNINIWKKKIDWIVENGGMVLMNTHPDYMNFGKDGSKIENYPSKYYKDILAYVKSKYNGSYWHVLPEQMAEYISAHKNLISTIPTASNAAGNQVIPKTNKLNVCMLGYFDYESDARVQNYVSMLLKKGYAVDIICCGEKTSRAQGAETPVSIFAIQRRTKEKKRIQYIWNLIRFSGHAMIKVSMQYFRKKYKVIHVHNVPDFLVFTSWLPKIFGAKLILDIHDILPEFYARKFNVSEDSRIINALKLTEKISCSFADHIIVANDIWRDRIVQRSANDKKCTSFINYLDTSIFPIVSSPKRSEKESATFTLIYHGSYSEHHGIDIAIRAISILKDKMGPFKLLLYGSGSYESELRTLVKTLRVENHVQFCTVVPYQEVPNILKSADLGIVPKKDGLFVGEAISTKLFQYVAMGIPAVVSRTVAEQRYFGEDEVKFFAPRNPEDMARCILELYENPQSRLDMAQRALKKMDGYSLSANTPKYLQIIDDLISEKSR